MPSETASTTPASSEAKSTPAVRGFRLEVVAGDDSGKSWESTGSSATIGTHESVDLRLTDETVSRFHCEIALDDTGSRIRDLGSSNGTVVDGVRVLDAYLKGGSLLIMGRSQVRFSFLLKNNRLKLSDRSRFGLLEGMSITSRALFARLEQAAASSATVLLEGETGTGKSAAARSLHAEGPRGQGPLVTVNCGAIPANLLESELFGHDKGAYTGAATARPGAFEDADGGTLFLDEIGEMPLELQPKLLSVLEDRTVRRVGGRHERSVDVRVIAATNRDLRSEVNSGRFRQDLYFRIAVLRVGLPTLRQRPDDIPLIAANLLTKLDATAEQRDQLLSAEFVGQLRDAAWPGNVRELRNYLEQYIVFGDTLGLELGPQASGVAVDASLPFTQAKQRAQQEIERSYVTQLLALHGGKVSAAAEAADIDRTYLYKLLRRHKITPGD